MKIHSVKTRFSNSCIVEYSDRLLVIDVAGQCHRQVLGYVEDVLGRPISDLKLAACTHDDPDHIGGLADLGKLCGAQVAVPWASGEAVNKLLNDPFGGIFRATTSFREAMRLRSWQMYASPGRDKEAKLGPNYQGSGTAVHNKTGQAVRLKDGQSLPGFDDWQIIHTPGHSWDSCCYYHAATGSLVSGDTLLGSSKKDCVVRPAIYANRQHFSQTLEKLGKLDIQAVYPGHGKVILGTCLLDRLG